MALYDALARFYDLEYAEFNDDIPFWLETAEEAGGPVLELGCGTGRVMLPLARAGYQVTGIEQSKAMLERASRRFSANRDLSRRVKLVQASMTDFDLAEKYGLAIIPLNAFMHLLNPAEQVAGLTRIRHHLRPGGTLVVDLPNPGDTYVGDASSLTLEREFPDETGTGRVLQFASTRLDRAAQLAHVTWIYDEVSPDGAVRRTVVPVTFRYTFPAEMTLLLEKAGLRLSHLYGDYERSPFSDGMSRMIVVGDSGNH
jgi:SAM-dependent methyltransferase